MDNPQPSPKKERKKSLDAVHRLDGGGLFVKKKK